MAEYLINDTSLSKLADAVRDNTGENVEMTIEEMGEKLNSSIIPVSKGGTGKTTGVDAANYFMNSLAEGTSTPTDKDYYISQYVGGGTTTTTYHRRPISALWTWIKGKCDSLYQAKGSYAAASHSHSWSSITGKPSALTYMPVGYVYISWSSTSPASLFGGSWAAITGRFPYFNAGTGQGGSNSHTLSVNEMPAHGHSIVWSWNSGDKNNGGTPWSITLQSPWQNGTVEDSHNAIGVKGGNASHNNMPSYQTLYAWRRTG